MKHCSKLLSLIIFIRKCLSKASISLLEEISDRKLADISLYILTRYMGNQAVHT